jgi:hypothetical protein
MKICKKTLIKRGSLFYRMVWTQLASVRSLWFCVINHNDRRGFFPYLCKIEKDFHKSHTSMRKLTKVELNQRQIIRARIRS